MTLWSNGTGILHELKVPIDGGHIDVLEERDYSGRVLL